MDNMLASKEKFLRSLPLPYYLLSRYGPYAAKSSQHRHADEAHVLHNLLRNFCETERRGQISHKTHTLSWGGTLNYILIEKNPSSSETPPIQENGQLKKKSTIVLCHGLCSGLGFFFPNYDYLADRFDRVLSVDWAGMGESSRNPTVSFPTQRSFFGDLVLSWLPFSPPSKLSTRLVNSPTQSSAFFVDSLHELLSKHVRIGEERVVLVGHSLGGYITGRYVHKYPEVVDALVLVSPVGVDDVAQPADIVSIPSPFKSLEKFRWYTMHSMLRIAWSANLTPQSLVRFVDPEKGREWIRNGLRRRFNERWNDEDLDVISNYLYKITAAPALGEYAMNSLLYPPMRVKPNSISTGVPSSVSSRAGSSSIEKGETNRIFARESLSKLLTQSLPQLHRETKRKIPVLLMYGDTDWLSYQNAENDMTKWREHYDMDASYRLVTNAGHHIYLDNPTMFHQTILGRLQERGLGGTPTK